MVVSKALSLKDERGFTLTEVVVTIIIMGIVFAALSSIFDMSLKVFSYGNNKVEAVESARVGMEKMGREIRQAYAFDRAAEDTHLFDTWTDSEIRFGNDLDGNGIIECPNTEPEPRCEKIGYAVYEYPADSGDFALGRDNTSTGVANMVENLQPVAEHVQSLTFTYLDRNGAEVDPLDPDVDDPEATVDRVLVSLEITVDQGIGIPGKQTLTTVIDLRNRG